MGADTGAGRDQEPSLETLSVTQRRPLVGVDPLSATIIGAGAIAALWAAVSQGGGETMAKKQKAPPTPIVPYDGRKFLAFESLVKWVQAGAVQAKRASTAMDHLTETTMLMARLSASSPSALPQIQAR